MQREDALDTGVTQHLCLGRARVAALPAELGGDKVPLLSHPSPSSPGGCRSRGGPPGTTRGAHISGIGGSKRKNPEELLSSAPGTRGMTTSSQLLGCQTGKKRKATRTAFLLPQEAFSIRSL